MVYYKCITDDKQAPRGFALRHWCQSAWPGTAGTGRGRAAPTRTSTRSRSATSRSAGTSTTGRCRAQPHLRERGRARPHDENGPARGPGRGRRRRGNRPLRVDRAGGRDSGCLRPDRRAPPRRRRHPLRAAREGPPTGTAVRHPGLQGEALGKGNGARPHTRSGRRREPVRPRSL